MIRIEDEIFLKKKFDFEKLKEFGFVLRITHIFIQKILWMEILKLSLKYRMF